MKNLKKIHGQRPKFIPQKYPMGLNSVFRFGKMKGKTVEMVIDEEPTYLRWCLDNVDNFELKDEAYSLAIIAIEDVEDDYDMTRFEDRY